MGKSAKAKANGAGANENGARVEEGTRQVRNMPEMSNPFVCPLSGKIFVDPVTASDGITYERVFIEEHVKKNESSPVVRGEKLQSQFFRNTNILSLIHQGAGEYLREIHTGRSFAELHEQYHERRERSVHLLMLRLIRSKKLRAYAKSSRTYRELSEAKDAVEKVRLELAPALKAEETKTQQEIQTIENEFNSKNNQLSKDIARLSGSLRTRS